MFFTFLTLNAMYDDKRIKIFRLNLVGWSVRPSHLRRKLKVSCIGEQTVGGDNHSFRRIMKFARRKNVGSGFRLIQSLLSPSPPSSIFANKSEEERFHFIRS